MATKRVRLPPLTPDQWHLPTREVLGAPLAPAPNLGADEVEEDGSPLPILEVIAHHPHLLGPFRDFNAALSAHGVLSRRAASILVMRTAWNCACPFEWGHGAAQARKAGLDDAEIERIALEPEHADWSAEDRALLDAADELNRLHDLSEETWSRLEAHFDDAELLEIPFLVGFEETLSMVANASGIPLDARMPRMPKRSA